MLETTRRKEIMALGVIMTAEPAAIACLPPEDEAELFLERLVVMPLADWYACAASGKEFLTEKAMRALDRAISTSEMLFAAWLLREHVATALYRFESPAGRSICPRARERDVRIATERAVQALLVRASLSLDDVQLLLGGFAHRAPLAHREAAP